MRNFQSIGLMVALTAIVVFADSNSAFAQRRGLSFGGSNNNNNNNNDSNSQDGNRRNREQDDEKNSDVQQFQQLIQGGQGGQGSKKGSGNTQQFRRGGQPGGQQNSQQLQNFQQQFGQGNNNWQKQKYNRHNDLKKWVVGFNGGPRPFSNDWYKNHPHAWKHNHHHDHDAWQITTAAGVVGWLGWQAARPYNTVYIYDPVPVETVIVDGQPQVVIEPATGEWLTLGTFSLMTGAGDPGTRILQLSIDREGHIRGSYYDMITNGTHNVIGVIDQNTQQARWTLDTNQQLTFVATLDQLTQSQGVVNVKLPGGQVQQWQLVRMENATASN